MQRPAWSDSKVLAVAHHEAGHAVAYFVLGCGVEFINTLPPGPFCRPCPPTGLPDPPGGSLRRARQAMEQFERGEIDLAEFEAASQAHTTEFDSYMNACMEVLCADRGRLRTVCIAALAGGIAEERFTGEF